MYEVYECKLKDTCLYVGSGKAGRHAHCTNGISHVYGLNRLHFSGVELSVNVLMLFETKQGAMNYEIEMINLNKPKFNKVFSDKLTADVNNKNFGNWHIEMKKLEEGNFVSQCYCGDKFCRNNPEQHYSYTSLESISDELLFKKDAKGYYFEPDEKLICKCNIVKEFENTRFKSKSEVRKFCVSVMLFYDKDWQKSTYDVDSNWKYMIYDMQLKLVFDV